LGITYHSSNKQAHSEEFLGAYGRGYPPPYVTPAPPLRFLTHMGGNSSLNKISEKNFVICEGWPVLFSLVGVPEKNSGKNFSLFL